MLQNTPKNLTKSVTDKTRLRVMSITSISHAHKTLYVDGPMFTILFVTKSEKAYPLSRWVAHVIQNPNVNSFPFTTE